MSRDSGKLVRPHMWAAPPRSCDWLPAGAPAQCGQASQYFQEKLEMQTFYVKSVQF